jgi:preprotein translocase subunit SecB
MADLENGAGAPTGDAAAERQLIINAQYVKDLSFENPRAPHSLLQQQTQPEVQLGVDVKAQNLAPDVFEVLLMVTAEAKAAGETIFMVELTYGAVVTLQNVPAELTGAMLLVEAPRLLFPFARAIVAQATREGGYPPLLIHPIDFAELARRQQEAQSAAGDATSV